MTHLDPAIGVSCHSALGRHEEFGDESEMRITAIEKQFWASKTSVRLADVEKAHESVVKLEEAINGSFRMMNRTLNRSVDWVKQVVNNADDNFETVKVQLVTLADRVDVLERGGIGNEIARSDRDSINSQSSTVSSQGPDQQQILERRLEILRQRQQDEQQLTPRNLPVHDAWADDDVQHAYIINMITNVVSPTMEFFGEESASAFDEWAERFKDFVSISGRNWSEEEKVTRFKMALKDTPRSLLRNCQQLTQRTWMLPW